MKDRDIISMIIVNIKLLYIIRDDIINEILEQKLFDKIAATNDIYMIYLIKNHMIIVFG